jgi:hypothetical protein
MNLKAVAVAPVKISSVGENPNFHAPEVLAGLADNSAALDVSEWKFRKPVKLARNGAQQLELDPEVLSHAQAGFGDLRLVRDGKQVPYILEHTSISRRLAPLVTRGINLKDRTLSRWIIKLPQSGLPVMRLACTARTALFEREMTLYEEVADERGEKYRRTVGQMSWIQKPDQINRELLLALNGPLQSDTLFLETHDGDNAPVELENFQVFYPASRVLFKAKADDALFLYYGNPRAALPRYDLNLVADQLLVADKSVAAFFAQEQLKKTSWLENQKPGSGGLVFWGILAVVVVVLLVIISRLLPKAPAA